MSLTMPQIIMLNHAASVNAKRSEERSDQREKKRKETEARKAELDKTDPEVWNGKRLSELTGDDMIAYYAS